MAPLAGRPPFATDLPDSAYAQPQPQPRYRQPPREDPNARTSAYNHYDSYLDGGNNNYNGAYNGNAAPTSVPQPAPQQMPLAAPKPGYAAPINALNQSSSLDAPRFPPGIEPAHMHHNQYEAPRMLPAALRPAPPPVAPISVPSTPHPLPPTMTPILPVFARPLEPAESRDVKWGPEPILRGGSEEKLLPRRGERGDDFWRRFSMVAREENQKPRSQKQSAWLRKTQSGTNRLSIWVWLIGVLIFSCAGLGIGLGWYLSHKAPNHQDPVSIGGSAGHVASATTSQPMGMTKSGSGSAPHVTPTFTLARRATFPEPFPTPAPGVSFHVKHVPQHGGPNHGFLPSRRQRRHHQLAME